MSLRFGFATVIIFWIAVEVFDRIHLFFKTNRLLYTRQHPVKMIEAAIRSNSCLCPPGFSHRPGHDAPHKYCSFYGSDHYAMDVLPGTDVLL